MSSDKRRRARIQGGWAAPQTTARSDRNKPQMATVPAWVGKKSVDTPTSQRFTYEESNEEICSKPKETTIDKTGIYDLSTEPSGVSRVRVFTSFIEPSECEWMFEQLSHELPWKQRSDVKNGEKYLQPRLTAWFGDLPYSYSGVTLDPNSQWTPLLQTLKERLEENTGFKFNSMLANMYRDGHDHVPWHSDDEGSLRVNPTIASLSFGDMRMFELRKKPPIDERHLGDYTKSEIVHVPIEAGTLMIMEGATQEDWQHRVTREYHDRGPRINLTFRVIYPQF